MSPRYYTVRLGGIAVRYLPELDGGGLAFGQQFLEAVRSRFGRVHHVFEFCAGPAFIGFSLLAHGLCDRLTLADVNPMAVAACRETIRANGLERHVTALVSDGLDDVPSSEAWDLVVGNPPHFEHAALHGRDIRVFDANFALHERFYGSVARFLRPGGNVLLQENLRGSRAERFAAMIASGGLRVVETFEIDSRRREQHPDLGRLRTVLRHAVRPIERALAHAPQLKRIVEDNDLFRAIQRRELLDASASYYFVRSAVSEDDVQRT